VFWLSQAGKDDIAYNNGQIMLSKLDELKIKHTYYESPGGHTWPVLRNDLYNFAPVLFK
jgi:S-formylglutathione hydrolase FrmB